MDNDDAAPDIVGYARKTDTRAKQGWRKAGKLFLVNTIGLDGKRNKNINDHTDPIFEASGERSGGNGTVPLHERIQFVDESEETAAKPLEERIQAHSESAIAARGRFNKSRAVPSHGRFWATAGHRFGAAVLAPFALAGTFLKRLAVGSGHSSDGKMENGVFVAPFTARRLAKAKAEEAQRAAEAEAQQKEAEENTFGRSPFDGQDPSI